LISAINTAIADGKATDAEKLNVNAEFQAYGNTLALYQKSVVAANKSIQDEIKRLAAVDATDKSNAAKKAAQDYALAKANLAETTAKAHADGKVTAEEKRAIQDATDKANAAKVAAIDAASAYADEKDRFANQAINDASNDNKITGSEKQQLKTVWDEINAEYSLIIEQAAKYNVSDNAFKLAYYAVNDYMPIALYTTGVKYFNTYATWFYAKRYGGEYLKMGYINLSTTNDIDGAKLRSIKAKYSEERAKINKIITGIAKDLADNNTAEIKEVTVDIIKTKDSIKAVVESVSEISNTINTSGWLTKDNGVTIFSSAEFSNGTKLQSLFTVTANKIAMKSKHIEITGALTLDGIFNAGKIKAEYIEVDSLVAKKLLVDGTEFKLSATTEDNGLVIKDSASRKQLFISSGDVTADHYKGGFIDFMTYTSWGVLFRDRLRINAINGLHVVSGTEGMGNPLDTYYVHPNGMRLGIVGVHPSLTYGKGTVYEENGYLKIRTS
jgi:hypothetical protein